MKNKNDIDYEKSLSAMTPGNINKAGFIANLNLTDAEFCLRQEILGFKRITAVKRLRARIRRLVRKEETKIKRQQKRKRKVDHGKKEKSQ